MTIEELYKYAVKNHMENLQVQVRYVHNEGETDKYEGSFFIRRDENDVVQLIHNPPMYDCSVDKKHLPDRYKDAISSDEITEKITGKGTWKDCDNGWRCSKCGLVSGLDYYNCPSCGKFMSNGTVDNF